MVTRPLLQLILHVTSRCDAACGACFSRRGTGEGLTVEECRRLAASLPPVPWLLLSGGEPTLRADLAEMVEPFAARGRLRHLTLPSNGLDPARLVRAARGVLAAAPQATVTLALSLDAPGREHDLLRGVPGAFGRACDSFRAARALKAEEPRLLLKIHTVVSAANLHSLRPMADLVRELGPDAHTFDLLRGEPADPAMVPPPAEELPGVLALVREVASWYRGRGPRGPLRWWAEAVAARAWELAPRILAEGRQRPRCRAPGHVLVVLPDGGVSFCELLPPWGNLRGGEPVSVLLHSPAARQAAAAVRAGCCACAHPCHQMVSIALDPVEALRAAWGAAFRRGR